MCAAAAGEEAAAGRRLGPPPPRLQPPPASGQRARPCVPPRPPGDGDRALALRGRPRRRTPARPCVRPSPTPPAPYPAGLDPSLPSPPAPQPPSPFPGRDGASLLRSPAAISRREEERAVGRRAPSPRRRPPASPCLRGERFLSSPHSAAGPAQWRRRVEAAAAGSGVS